MCAQALLVHVETTLRHMLCAPWVSPQPGGHVAMVMGLLARLRFSCINQKLQITVG